MNLLPDLLRYASCQIQSCQPFAVIFYIHCILPVELPDLPASFNLLPFALPAVGWLSCPLPFAVAIFCQRCHLLVPVASWCYLLPVASRSLPLSFTRCVASFAVTLPIDLPLPFAVVVEFYLLPLRCQPLPDCQPRCWCVAHVTFLRCILLPVALNLL